MTFDLYVILGIVVGLLACILIELVRIKEAIKK